MFGCTFPSLILSFPSTRAMGWFPAGPNTNGSQFFLCTAKTSWYCANFVMKLLALNNTCISRSQLTSNCSTMLRVLHALVSNRLDGKHVVWVFGLAVHILWWSYPSQTLFRLSFRRFGKVVAGSDVVSAIEQVGSESGTTRVPVVIADCGQLR